MERYVPKKQWMAYAVGALGQGMIYAIMSSYISDFYMNVLKLTPIFVLLLMLLARIWDAVNDPIMGYIADRANLKRGKMRPYLIYTPIPIAILTILLFYAPNLSATGLMIYASITYVAWGMIYTSSDVPFWSMPNVMTPDPAERGEIISKAKTANGVGTAVPIVFFMALGFILPKLNLSGTELEKTKYMTIALFCAIVGNLLFARVYFKVKENIVLPNPPKRKKGEKTALYYLLSCKPLMLTAIMGVLASARYMYQAGAVHVARYSFYIGQDLTGLTGAEKEAALQGNISLVSLVFQVASAAGMFGAMLVMPALFKKFNYKQLLISTSLLGAASSMVIWFLGYERFWACVPFFVISCIPLGVINVCLGTMIGDCLDYMEWKTGHRLTGMGSAVQSFVNKLGNAISTSFIIVMYMIVNLNVADISANVTANPLEMSATVRTGMFSLISIIPAVSLLLCIIPLFFYDLVGEKKERITRELAEQRKAKGIVIQKG
ncbi:MAG TPA: MFS transporter [Candidatus Fimivicinus intestinavium]|nr:MFS transporter [Candidatus Fimivicinus intestinavium]